MGNIALPTCFDCLLEHAGLVPRYESAALLSGFEKPRHLSSGIL
jgi:hypothetical protein